VLQALWLIPIMLLLAGAAPPAVSDADSDFMERRIRPVLVEQCQKCHGPQKQMGGLRLDSRSALLQGGDRGPALQPGDPRGSLLLRAVRHQGDLKMPPKVRLSDQAVTDLEAWIQRGAHWPQARPATDPGPDAWKRHWAFQPLRNPTPPAVRQTDWVRQPLDRYILAALEKRGLTPALPAERRTLIRRACFTLTGLPPTPEEVVAFEADPAPDAYARLIDRLLESPHYGERWARHWLDVARYADTKGYVFFEEAQFPWAYTYRDYVIRAFNEDLPYDQFIVQQLAADQLPLPTDRRPLAALGFLTVGGRFMNNPHDILDDRIDVVTRGLMGLTVTCARCHDHKFDPIPTRDYYSLYGVFASSQEPDVPPLLAAPPDTKEYLAFEKELKERERQLAEFLQTKQTEVVGAARRRAAEYLLAAQAMKDQPPIDDFMLLADGGDLNPTMLIRWRNYLERSRKRHHPVLALWNELAALTGQDFAGQAQALLARAADPARPLNPLLLQVFRSRPPASLAEAARLLAEVLNDVDKEWQQALDKAQSAGGPPPGKMSDPVKEELRQVFHGPEAAPAVTLTLFNSLALLPDRPAQGQYRKLRDAVDKWRATGPGAPPRAMVLVDAPTLYQPRVFVRGNPNNLGEPVPRQLPGVLVSTPVANAPGSHRPFQHGSGRLELARAIADPSNPLTARVFVNRVWMHHLGAGLVRTPGDFGLRSDPPSHPELLDHLASTFSAGGWSIKKLHRTILLSATFQQQSRDRPECRNSDPENTLLWKMNRRRLDFESLRDSLLAVAGRLDPVVGGPSVQNILAPTATRRTLYGWLDRLSVPGIWRSFDFPSPDATAAQRDLTTIPQQGLFLLNHPLVLECARGALKRADIRNESDPARRILLLHRLVLGRPPTAEEIRLAQSFLGEQPGPIAWERYTQALFITNEFVFVD